MNGYYKTKQIVEELENLKELLSWKKDGKDTTKTEQEWIHYRNGISEFQGILDDKLKAETNLAYNPKLLFLKEVKKTYEKIFICLLLKKREVF